MKVIYHSRDLDGWASAAIIKRYFECGVQPSVFRDIVLDSMEFVPYDYGQPIPVSAPLEPVVIVDVSLPIADMHELSKRANGNMVWIDHHVAAINEYKKWVEQYGEFCVAVHNPEKIAACELTWNHFFPALKMPAMIELLGAYDCFRHKGTAESQKVLWFQYGVRAICNDMKSTEAMLARGGWGETVRTESILIHNIMHHGQIIHEAESARILQVYKESTFILWYDDLKIGAVNAERINPVNYGIDYHNDGFDAYLNFWYKNGKWYFSLYNDNDKVDCSEIAKRLGGGGHKGAAGWQTNDIDWLYVYFQKPAKA